ncbi:ATP phosphoribosyltransferase regulatory subunit [bacterium]|nr:ATP phosphoribosyltransferase regulatory subunit [bacterium]
MKTLRYDEYISIKLRELYTSFGYSLYSMSKFEEYDLYSKNKDFLISDYVITFTDTTGKLMALKPDVTLSIIKNTDIKESLIEKLCYNEKVYRVKREGDSFKEIMQTGLEAIGDIDSYTISEVLYLAMKSLNQISSNYNLDVSSMDIIKKALDVLPKSCDRSKLIKYIGNKSTHEIKSYLSSENIDESLYSPLVSLVSTSGKPSDIKAELEEIVSKIDAKAELDKLYNVIDEIKEENTRIDFSVILDPNYYNGIVFRGYVSEISESILSGGEYNNLMKRMNKKSKGVGFAVYLDSIDSLDTLEEYDFDYQIIYKKDSKELRKFVFSLQKDNKVYVAKEINTKIKVREVIEFKE